MDPRKGREQVVVEEEEEDLSRRRGTGGFGKLVTTSGGRPGGSKTNYISRFADLPCQLFGWQGQP